MYKFLKNLSCLVCLLALFGSCRKKAFDDYYGRPANLAPPIYQVLESKGNFTTLLKVIDLSGYKANLSAGGYWTFFAPNDAAFTKYFAATNSSLASMNADAARKIVAYCLVYNAFKTDRLADYQSNAGWVPGIAFKRRTAYYDGFMTGAGPDGAATVYTSENRNIGTYVFGDNNNKYIPYFFSTFMDGAKLTAADYNYFFPNSTYTGFNVVNASVVNKDIIAENGVIHEIDQVVTPLPSIEQKLSSNDQYSVFKGLYDKYLVTFTKDDNYTRQYNTITGKTNTAYVKVYNSTLNYAIGNENYMKLENDDGQKDGYTLFAPNNTALQPYITNTLLEFYGTLDKLPANILADFMNSHMFSNMVWPTKFATTKNNANEEARFDPATNVIDKQFCSNGIFYGVNKVQQANVFSTVYARAYLDPAYSIMTRILDLTIKIPVTTPGLRYAVFMMPDNVLRTMGFDYDPITSSFTQTVSGVKSSGDVPKAALTRLLNLCVVPTPNNEMNNLAGDGIIETNGGEYIRWHNNTVFNAGFYEQSKAATVIGSRDYVNGRVYYLDNQLFPFPANTIYTDIANNAVKTTDPYYDFFQYLSNSALAGSTSTSTQKEIVGIQLGAPYTIFIPTQAAMKQAVVDGYLPGTTTGTGTAKQFVSFNYKPTDPNDIAKVSQFIYYHILSGITIVPDGKKGPNGNAFPTMLKTQTGNALTISSFNQPNNLRLEDMTARFANVLPPNNSGFFPATSNYLGTYCVIHQIDNYLRFNLN